MFFQPETSPHQIRTIPSPQSGVLPRRTTLWMVQVTLVPWRTAWKAPRRRSTLPTGGSVPKSTSSGPPLRVIIGGSIKYWKEKLYVKITWTCINGLLNYVYLITYTVYKSKPCFESILHKLKYFVDAVIAYLGHWLTLITAKLSF